MKIILALLLAFAATAHADDAVLFSYVLEEQKSAKSVTTSEFGFLVHFDKQASAEIGGTAKLDMIAEDEGNSVRVDLTLNDYVADRVHLVGTTSRSIPYGSTQVITWNPPRFGTYKLSVTPRRHTLR